MSLNSGSCWDILELEATGDKKAIKRAYHKLLRLHKPDEKPDEFKILYQAYQDALSWSNYYSESSEERDKEFHSDRPEQPTRYLEEIEPINTTPSKEEQEAQEMRNRQHELYRHDEKMWQLFKEKVDRLTYDADDTHAFNTMENWDFVEEMTMQSSLETSRRFADYLFDAINDLDEHCFDELLSQKVIAHLNTFFLWDKQWQEYDSETPIFEYLYPKITNPKLKEPYERATIKERFIAFCIDIAITAAVLGLLKFEDITSGEQLFTHSTLSGIMISYIFYVLFSWITFGKRTVGLMVMKLKVYECYMLYDEHVYQGYGCGEPSWTARVSRLLLLIIALSTLLQAVKQIGSFSLSHLIVLLNLYLLLQKEKLLQDFSGTKVFKYHKDQV